jgi:hypothetical protein
MPYGNALWTLARGGMDEDLLAIASAFSVSEIDPELAEGAR